MSTQFSVAVRNARGNAIEATVGTAPKLQIFTGAKPADCATASSGTKLAEMALPSDWFSAFSSGAGSKVGTWEDTSADNAGTAGYYRIVDTAGTTCHMQGTVTATGGGGDMTLDNVSIASTQDVIVTSFTITEGNA